MIRLLKKAMQFVCLALMLVVLMAVVSVADGDMPLLNGVILFISCLLGVNTCLGIWFKLDDKERGRRVLSPPQAPALSTRPTPKTMTRTPRLTSSWNSTPRLAAWPKPKRWLKSTFGCTTNFLRRCSLPTPAMFGMWPVWVSVSKATAFGMDAISAHRQSTQSTKTALQQPLQAAGYWRDIDG